LQSFWIRPEIVPTGFRRSARNESTVRDRRRKQSRRWPVYLKNIPIGFGSGFGFGFNCFYFI
jgi:hypothetical protein